MRVRSTYVQSRHLLPTVTNHQCTVHKAGAGYRARYSDLCKPSFPHTSSTLESTTHFHSLATHAITQYALPTPPYHQKETVPSCRHWLAKCSWRINELECYRSEHHGQELLPIQHHQQVPYHSVESMHIPFSTSSSAKWS